MDGVAREARTLGVSQTRFDPKPLDVLTLFGQAYTVQAHPASPKFRFSAQGRKAQVFQLRDRLSEPWALKVFKPEFRHPGLSASMDALRKLQDLGLKGVDAARRRMVMPGDKVLEEYANLEYAMLMPWIPGTTWSDVLIQCATRATYLSKRTALQLCCAFLDVMTGIENHDFAHTDISAGNLIVDLTCSTVQLLDLEDLYMQTAPEPGQRNLGSNGYRHPNAVQGATLWNRNGDRYASAVMAAEMLALSNPKLASMASDEGFFAGNRDDPQAQERFEVAQDWLRQIAPDFVGPFVQAWTSSMLATCPSISALHLTVPRVPVRSQTLISSSWHPASDIVWKALPTKGLPTKRHDVESGEKDRLEETPIPASVPVGPVKSPRTQRILIGLAVFFAVAVIALLLCYLRART